MKRNSKILILNSAIFFTSLGSIFSVSASEKTNSCVIILERFQKPLKIIKNFLTAEGSNDEREGSNHDRISDMMDHDMRGQVFRLEGLARIYERIHGKKFKKMRALTKELEDALGYYDEKNEYYETARSWNKPKGVIPEEAIIFLGEERNKGFLKLQDLLNKHWLLNTHPSKSHRTDYVARIQSKIRNTDFESKEFDRSHVLRAFMDDIKKVDQTSYDMSDLQNGIHEYRRQLRWFLIYMQAFDGLFQLEPIEIPEAKSPNEYRYLQTHSLATGKFSTLPINKKVQPVFIPQPIFLAISKAVTELGVIKSLGENMEALADALQQTGMSKNGASALVTKIVESQGKSTDVFRQAEVLQDEIKRTELLKKLRKILKSQKESD